MNSKNLTTNLDRPQREERSAPATEIERAVVDVCERFRAIYGFRSVEAYQTYVAEFQRLARDVDRLEAKDVTIAGDKILQKQDRRPMPSQIIERLESARDMREVEARNSRFALKAPPGDDEAARIAMAFILDSKIRGRKFAGVDVDAAGYVTEIGMREIIATLSETARGYVDEWIRRARGTSKLDARADKFAYDLRFMLKTQRSKTEGKLGDYRRLTAPLRN